MLNVCTQIRLSKPKTIVTLQSTAFFDPSVNAEDPNLHAELLTPEKNVTMDEA
jgi:hypothetical protein